MADCMMHGQSAPGPCPECEANIRAGRSGSDDGPKKIYPYRAFFRERVGGLATEKGKGFALKALTERKKQNKIRSYPF